MSAPSPCNVTQTPQREFAGAKVRIIFEICKFFAKNRLRKGEKERKAELSLLVRDVIRGSWRWGRS